MTEILETDPDADANADHKRFMNHITLKSLRNQCHGQKKSLTLGFHHGQFCQIW